MNKFKDHYVDQIMAILFLPEQRRLDKIVSELCIKNGQIKGTVCYGFIFQGERYVPSEHMNKLKHLKSLGSLAINLLNEVNAFKCDKQKITNDMTHIKQLLFNMTFQCCDRQELRDSLPECVVNLTDLKNLPRICQDPTRFLRDNRWYMEEYERVLPKIEFYSTMHLIY